MWGYLKKLLSGKGNKDAADLLGKGALIVDVRTPGEFKAGHIEGSVNIPLDRLRERIPELKAKGKPIVTCCRSGNRSGIAKGILTNAGIECANGGPWFVLQRKR